MRLARWINAFTALALLAFVAPALASGGDVKASAPSGFTVIALVTTDQDWLRKWNTPTPGVALQWHRHAASRPEGDARGILLQRTVEWRPDRALL